jgi:hypothetical protein
MGTRKQSLLPFGLAVKKSHLQDAYQFNLKNNEVTSLDMKGIIDALQDHGALEVLEVDCSKNKLDDAAVMIIVKWFRLNVLPDLFTFNVSHNHFSQEGIECIKEAAKKYGNPKWRILAKHNSAKLSSLGVYGLYAPEQPSIKDLLQRLKDEPIAIKMERRAH